MAIPRTKEGKVDGGKLYRKGRAKEYKIVNSYKDRGFIAFRSAGSHSPIDVVGIDTRKRRIYLIQAKSGFSKERLKQKLEEENKDLNGLFEVRFKVV